MDAMYVVAIGFAVLFVTLLLGIPVGFCLLLSGFIGLALMRPWDVALASLFLKPWDFASSHTFSVVVLFILAGHIAYVSGIAQDAYYVGNKLLRGIPGGLPIASLFGCAAFAGVSGSSVATVAAIGQAALPELKRLGFDNKISAGTLAASGTLGTLIPPSVSMVVFGIISNTSIGGLLIGGIIPGIVSALIYASMLYIRFRLDPKLGPPPLQNVPVKEVLSSLPKLLPVVVLFVLMIGGIYSGIFTPSEAGAAGAFLAFLFLMIKRKDKWAATRESIFGSTKVIGVLLLMLLGASLFSHFITVSALPMRLGDLALSLDVPRYVTLGMLLSLYFFLGLFLSGTPTILITTPIVVPAILAMGYDPIWFGIIVMKMVEIASITPPVGVTVYTVKAIAPEISLVDIFKGSGWFLVMDFLTLILLIAVPDLVTFLPRMMIG